MRLPLVLALGCALALPAVARAETIEVDGGILRVDVRAAVPGGTPTGAVVAPLPGGGAAISLFGVPPSLVTLGAGCQPVSTNDAPQAPATGTPISGPGGPDFAATCDLTGVTAVVGRLMDLERPQAWVSTLTLSTVVDALFIENGQAPGDVILTGPGGDVINAGNGPDLIDGGGAPYKGQETAIPVNGANVKNPDRNTLNGGGGNDLFRLDGLMTGSGATGRDVVKGGAGVDTATYAMRFGIGAPGQLGVNVSLNGEPDDGDPSIDPPDSVTPGEGDDVDTDVENVTGTKREDTLVGSSSGNVLEGDQGRDTLTGGAGVDTLLAREPLSAGSGLQDTLSCGAPAPPPPPPPAGLRKKSTQLVSIGIFLAATGRDRLEADLLDVPPADCEDVVVMAIDEPAAVRVGGSAKLARGGLRAALTCPRAARRSCVGTLRVAGRRAGGPATRYRIRRGGKRKVRVGLSRLAAHSLSGAGRAVRLVSEEAGREGDVTRFAIVKVRGR